MALGLPAHLRPVTYGEAYRRAAHTIGGVSLLAAFVIFTTGSAEDPTLSQIWPGTLALVVTGAMLVWLDLRPSLWLGIAYLLVGGVAAYVVADEIMALYPTLASDSFIPMTMRVALGLVAGPGRHAIVAVAWCIAGLVVAEVAITSAALAHGVPLAIDVTAMLVLASVLLIFLVMNRVQTALTPAQPRIHRAVDAESLASTRSSLEARAAAVLHDTVLGDLAAVAAASPGPLEPRLADRVRRDLDLLARDDWLIDAPESASVVGGPFAAALEDARTLGLTLDLSGDLDVLGRLRAPTALALAQAARQCLVNVHKHAGTDRVAVIVSTADSALSVMVVDSGRGFDVAAVGADRLGLRHSVRRRIEEAGGSVRIWSAPGRGTSVVLRVPVLDPIAEAAR